MTTFTIKDLEVLSGIKAHTIRVWEQRYSLLKPGRTNSNVRRYDKEELKSLLGIALLNRNGYRISHIHRMSPGGIRERISTLSQTAARQERMVNELIERMVDLDLERFEAMLDECIGQRGIQRTISQVIFPFLKRTGIHWTTQKIQPSPEHLVGHIIRQKLIVGLDGLSGNIAVNKSVILFLPEEEYHELGLLYAYYQFKSRGVKTLYLGAGFDMEHIQMLVRSRRPDFLFTHLTCYPPHLNPDTYFNRLALKIPDTPIVLSGQCALHPFKRIPPRLLLKKSPEDLTSFVACL